MVVLPLDIWARLRFQHIASHFFNPVPQYNMIKVNQCDFLTEKKSA